MLKWISAFKKSHHHQQQQPQDSKKLKLKPNPKPEPEVATEPEPEPELELDPEIRFTLIPNLLDESVCVQKSDDDRSQQLFTPTIININNNDDTHVIDTPYLIERKHNSAPASIVVSIVFKLRNRHKIGTFYSAIMTSRSCPKVNRSLAYKTEFCEWRRLITVQVRNYKLHSRSYQICNRK